MLKETFIRPTKAVWVIAVVFALAMGLLAGCGSSAGSDSGTSDGTDAVSETEAAADETYRLHATYGGIRFDLPEGWTVLVTDGTLTMEIPEGGAVDVNVQGTIARGAATEGDEQASVDGYVDGIVEALSQQEGFQEEGYSASIEGIPSKATKCSLSANGMKVEVYVVAVAADGNITNLIMASSEGECDAQFESIIDSITLAQA